MIISLPCTLSENLTLSAELSRSEHLSRLPADQEEITILWDCLFVVILIGNVKRGLASTNSNLIELALTVCPQVSTITGGAIQIGNRRFSTW